MSEQTSRRTFLKQGGALGTVGLAGLAGCQLTGGGGSESPDVLMVVGYPQSGIQLFSDYYSDYGDDDADILVTDGLIDGDMVDEVGNDFSNVRGTAPSAAGDEIDTFESSFQDEFDADPTVFTAQAYDATAVQILANLMAGENDGPAVRDHMRVVANPGGETYGPSSMVEAAEAAAAGENIQYQGPSGSVEFDENGDIVSGAYDVFDFGEGLGSPADTTEFEADMEVPEPEPQGDGSDSGRTVRFGVLQPESGDLGSLGVAIAQAATLPALELEGEVDFEFDFTRADTQSQAQPAIDAANSLVSDGYPSLTGAASSESSIQVAENVLVDSEVVGCSPASTSPDITDLEDDGFMFRTAPSDAYQGRALAGVAVDDLEAESAATLYLNNSYGQALNDQFVTAFEDEDGEVLEQVGFESQQNSYTSEINTAMGS